MKNIKCRQLFSGVDIESYNIVEFLFLLIIKLIKTERFDTKEEDLWVEMFSFY